jgi:hypothetical protein
MRDGGADTRFVHLDLIDAKSMQQGADLVVLGSWTVDRLAGYYPRAGLTADSLRTERDAALPATNHSWTSSGLASRRSAVPTGISRASRRRARVQAPCSRSRASGGAPVLKTGQPISVCQAPSSEVSCRPTT